MPLKFQCDQDPANMKTVRGKKYCDQCCQFVHDVRRKSIDKILSLQKENETFCAIIYDDQLDLLEMLNSSSKSRKKTKFSLPAAAGLAAITLAPLNAFSQTNDAEVNIECRDAEGITRVKKAEISKSKIDTNKKTVIRGRVIESSKLTKAMRFYLGYYVLDSNNVRTFRVIKKFTSSLSGKFSMKISAEELQLIRSNKISIRTDKKHRVRWRYDFDVCSGVLEIEVNKKQRRVGMVAF